MAHMLYDNCATWQGVKIKKKRWQKVQGLEKIKKEMKDWKLNNAGPWGTVAGIVVGLAFGTGEIFYDDIGKPAANTLTQGFDSMENGLNSSTWHF